MKLMSWICMLSLALVIGSAGALEICAIGLGQALVQMGIGTFGFWASAKALWR